MTAAANASSVTLILTITLSIVLSYHIIGIYGFSLTKSGSNCHSFSSNFRIPKSPVLRVAAKQNTQRILPKLEWLGVRGDGSYDSFIVVYKSVVKTLWLLKQNAQQYDNDDDDDSKLQQDIDAFLSGEYDRSFADDAPAPYPGLSPRKTIEAVLESLQQINNPEPAHGAAVLQRFCAPLGRGERWGGGSVHKDPWKEVLRGAITPTMLARRLRASSFSVLLDHTKADVTDGYSKDEVGVPSISFVNAALFFQAGMEPVLVQFTLHRYGGVWLIDTARVSKKELFVQQSNETDWKNS